MRANGMDAQLIRDIGKDIANLLVQPAFSNFQAALQVFLEVWDPKAPHFVAYFRKEWLHNSKHLQWALYARSVDFDTGDQKGEGYNLYLKAVPFHGQREVALSKALAILSDEFKAVGGMLATPRLVVERYRAFEHSQRKHDPFRLAFLDEDRVIEEMQEANSPPPASPPPLDTSVVSQDILESLASIIGDELHPAVFPALPSARALAAPPSAPVAAAAPAPCLLAPLPAAQLALLGSGDKICPYCTKDKKNNVCALKACVACCSRSMEHCSVTGHARLKAETLCPDLIARIRTLPTLPEDQRHVYISYSSGTSPLECRQIQVCGWKAEPWCILARCLLKPEQPQIKSFILVRIKRIEDQPWAA